MLDPPLDFPAEPILFLFPCIRKNFISFTGNQMNLDEFHQGGPSCQGGPDCKWSKTGWFRNLGIECWACVWVLYNTPQAPRFSERHEVYDIQGYAERNITLEIFRAHSLIIPTAKSIYNNYLCYMQIVITVWYCFPYDIEKDPVKNHLVLTRVLPVGEMSTHTLLLEG